VAARIGGPVTSVVFRATRSWVRQGATVRSWRERRYRLFMEGCAVAPSETILDVGAGAGEALAQFNQSNPIVAVDLEPLESEWMSQANIKVVQGDGTKLPFRDRQFAVAFSNSVIEHVPRDAQEAFAREIRRVAERYYVQTPNRFFPIEPHYQLPLFQFLPGRMQRFLNRHFTLGWRERGHWEDVNLLSRRSLQRLFPDAEIHRERVFGLTKSLMAVRGPAELED
jgi:2-polyprenyl-3-methyl-5-hydroxy-6-metoxy-1,4-benzoquinol methylase